MVDQIGKKGKRWSNLKKTYRLVIRTDETLEEVTSLKLSPLNVYILLCTVFVLVACMVVALIIYTPLKTYIPGYGDINENREYIVMLDRVNNLDKQVEAQSIYIEGMRKMIMGDVDNDLIGSNDSVLDISDKEVVDRIPEDEILRQTVGLDENLTLASASLSKRIEEASTKAPFFFAPVRGITSLSFSRGKKHFGVDVLAPANTPVLSVLNGYVVSSGWTIEDGYTVAVQHERNLISIYKHNSFLLKSTGDYVKAGEAIAIIGNTGIHSDGPHLHFELWRAGKPLDPEQYIEFGEIRRLISR